MTSSRPGFPPARPARAVIAYLVDLLVVAAVGTVTWWWSRSAVLTGLVVAQALAVLVLVVSRYGRTPGAALLRIARVAEGTTRAPGLGPALLRACLMGLLHVTVLGPLVTILLGRDGHDWVDRLSRTEVVDLRPDAPSHAPTHRTRRGEAQRVPEGWQSPAIAWAMPSYPSPTPPPPPTPGASPELPEGWGPLPEPPRSWLLLPWGDRVAVDGPVFVGRSPQVSSEDGTCLTLPDPTGQLSRTHLIVGPVPGGIWLEDVSTTGTELMQPDGSVSRVQRGERVVAGPGAAILLHGTSLVVAATGQPARHP